MRWVPGTQGVLFDVDGTLLLGRQAAPGAAELLERLRLLRIPFRLTTNTTRKSRSAVARALREAGIQVEDADVLAPSTLARRQILDSGKRRAMLLVARDARRDFDGVERVEEGACDWVVVGDLGRDFTWEVLNRAFHAIRAGARLLALQKNRFWHTEDLQVAIDAGPFVAALEYAGDVEAEVVGKPSRAFFDLAFALLGVESQDVLVVGDDFENDARGGSAAGGRTALVRTGKFEASMLAGSAWRPDLVLDTVGDLEPPGA